MLRRTLLFSLSIAVSFKISYCLQEDRAANVPKIAIIGGGIGGTSVAYFLHELFGDDAILDLYESDVIGGRLATIPIAENVYEVGGSVIHPRNEYMMQFASAFGLAHNNGCPGHLGLFDGDDYVFTDSDWTIITLAKLFWRYGFDIYRLNKLTEEMLSNFANIYKLQEEGKAFRKVATLLNAMDPRFLEMTRSSSTSWLKGLGFHDLMIQEFVMAVTKSNYGQTPDIQAFVGAIAVAAADSNLWSVSGGNRRVPEELLKASRASWLRRLVTEIVMREDGPFTITSVDAETPMKHLFKEGSEPDQHEIDNETARSQDYDIVIVATPLTDDKSNIKFTNFTEELKFPGRYERIVCTMVQGKLRPESLQMLRDEPLDEILVTNPRLIFNSIGKQYPVNTDCKQKYPDVWKIFSPRPISEDQMKIFFEERNSTTVIDWLAYPHYDSNQNLPDFELVPGMYHLNAIEWAGSAMEMEVIGAKNVALLAYKYWKQDPNAGNKVIKDEL